MTHAAAHARDRGLVRWAVGRPVRVRPVPGDGRAEPEHPLRLGARPVRHRRLAGARPGAAAGRAAVRRRADRHARRAGRTGAGRGIRGVPAGTGGRGRAHRPGARPAGPGRQGPRRQAAGRPVPQRPGRHAVPDVPARPRPDASAGWSPTCRTALLDQAQAPPRARRCPGAPTSSTPSRCCWPTTWPRTPRRWPGTSTGSGTGTAAPRCPRTARGRSPGRHSAWTRPRSPADLGFDAPGAELHRRHLVPRLRRRAGVRARDDRGERVPLGRGGDRLLHRGVRLRSGWTTRSPPGRRSCRRRRTRTSPSWPAARPAGSSGTSPGCWPRSRRCRWPTTGTCRRTRSR